MVHRRIVIPLLVLCLVLQACAVQRSKAPQLTPQTITELNIAAQLKQANQDYITFFTGLGKVKIAPNDLASINNVGHHLKTYLDEANKLWVDYYKTKDQAMLPRMTQLLVDASGDFTVMLAQKAAAVQKGTLVH